MPCRSASVGLGIFYHEHKACNFLIHVEKSLSNDPLERAAARPPSRASVSDVKKGWLLAYACLLLLACFLLLLVAWLVACGTAKFSQAPPVLSRRGEGEGETGRAGTGRVPFFGFGGL